MVNDTKENQIRNQLYSLDLQSQFEFIANKFEKDLKNGQRNDPSYMGDPFLGKLLGLVSLRVACMFEGPTIQSVLGQAIEVVGAIIDGGKIPDGTSNMNSCYELLGELVSLTSIHNSKSISTMESFFQKGSSRTPCQQYLDTLRNRGPEALRSEVRQSTLGSVALFSTGPTPGKQWD